MTGELEKLSVRDKYNGRDQVRTASGAGMKISNIGHTTLHTPVKDLHLKNILHVPSASKSLVSVHKLARDNDAFLEFHPNFFLIKEQRESFIEVDAKGAYIPLRHISLKRVQVNKSMGSSISRQLLDGIVG